MVILKKQQQIGSGLLSASRKHFSGRAEAHVHEFFEIELVLSGSGTCVIDGNAYPMQQGSLFLLTPANTHAVQDADAELINVMFQCDYNGNAFSTVLSGALSSPLFLLEPQEYELMVTFFAELIRVQESNPHYARTLLDCALQRLAEHPRAANDTVLPYIQHALLYITEHFRDGITLADTAAHIGLSATYFSELFAAETGTPFKAYLDNLRFSHAKNLLAFTDIPICRIHEYAGFGDYANFSRRFRRLMGGTPGEYRKKRKTV